jgi:hypothetical protein
LTPGWSAAYGPGTYLSHDGDVRSEKFYSKQGRDRTRKTSSVILADVDLSNPLFISGRDSIAIRKDFVAKLGGPEVVAEHFVKLKAAQTATAQKLAAEVMPDVYQKVKDTPPEHWFLMGEDYDTVMRFEDRLKAAGIDLFQVGLMQNLTTPAGVRKMYEGYKPGMSDQHDWADRTLAEMAKAQGYDGLVVEDTHGFTPSVGGSQIVVFDPTTIKVKGVRPVTAAATK